MLKTLRFLDKIENFTFIEMHVTKISTAKLQCLWLGVSYFRDFLAKSAIGFHKR